MKRTVLCITFTLVLVLMCRSVFAMPANPAPFEVRQPDGLPPVRLFLREFTFFLLLTIKTNLDIICSVFLQKNSGGF
jgi:hypothetical protein